MATIPIQSLAPRDQQPCKYIAAGEESGQTYKEGAPLVYDATSQEGEEWAGGTDATAITGIAARNASETAGTKCPYYEAKPDTIFVGTFMNGTSNLELAASHYDTEYSLLKQSSGMWTIDQSDTSTKLVHVIGPASGSEVGDTNARVEFRFLTGKMADVPAS